MPDPVIAAAMVLLAAMIELSSRPLVPIGSVLAIGVLLGDGTVGPVALLGAAGVTLAHFALAVGARRGRDRLATSPMAKAQRDALRARMAASGAFARITFIMAALPGPTAKVVYPVLGAMRAPLLPAMAGTLVGRSVLYVITTAIFTGIARWLAEGDDQKAAQLLLGAIVLLALFRMVRWIDWQHRAATGEWRLTDPAANGLDARMFTPGVGGGMPGPMFGDVPGPHERGAADDDTGDGEVLEGDVIGEEVLDDHEADEDPDADQSSSSSNEPPELPRGS